MEIEMWYVQTFSKSSSNASDFTIKVKVEFGCELTHLNRYEMLMIQLRLWFINLRNQYLGLSDKLTCHPSFPLSPPLIAYASLKPFLNNNSATSREFPSKLPYTKTEYSEKCSQ